VFDADEKEATMHTTDAPRHRTRRFAVSIFLAAIAAAVVVQAAGAVLDSSAVTGGASTGDVKNQLPFTRSVTSSPSVALATEPKNELPFTRVVAGSIAGVNARAQAEARNEQFVTPQFQASSGTVLHLRRDKNLAQTFETTTTSSSSINWTLIAAISAALATLGVGMAAAMLVRHRVPRTA
jgi:hypothetical protein